MNSFNNKRAKSELVRSSARDYIKNKLDKTLNMEDNYKSKLVLGAYHYIISFHVEEYVCARILTPCDNILDT